MREDLAAHYGFGAALARLLTALSVVLVVVFLVGVVTTAMPLKLFDPLWQLAFIAVLINNASLALVGCLLWPMALWYDPNNHRLRARWKSLRVGILAAVLGFLLIIPLQSYAGWRFQRTFTVSQKEQAIKSAHKLSDFREAITSATTHLELQAKVQKLIDRNAELTPSELRTPLPELRNILLARAEQASNQLTQQIEAQAALAPNQQLKETIRIAVSALAYAIGFSFLAGV